MPQSYMYSRPPNTAAFGTCKKTHYSENGSIQKKAVLGATFNPKKAYLELENRRQLKEGSG